SEDLLKLEITDIQLEQYYEENKEKYKASLITQVSVTPKDKDNVDTDKLQHFLKTIKTRLQKDENLDDLSNNSLYNVKIKKAAEVRRDKYYKALADTIFNMSVGEISEPVKLKNSYIILKILEGPYYLPFKKVKNNIKFEVRNNNFNSYLKNLKDSENVEIYISEEIKETKSNAEN
ncbi:MAG: peptidyl-prolyl cis-trans isomerase, partial [Candidatus Dadabacteria bacterium]|nr:peptidyl-prolyl cis-trans isomerase [Candidatus Dadabacteria bacterium]NIS07906.1 peptidyl-prolyl cis-trans isomerase [Candidatus Dadabacteria bacterium]NIV42158.1 hypothetical protein [Candidatus Dadabacteria bacterium]NIX14896.1 hypothetical protein [Candidatus Dadabacteria bacterium]NIY21492.1 hypothetical protein [Candidatus Dadabacteria bacterium]